MKKLIIILMLICSTAYAGEVTIQSGLLTTQNSNYGESVSVNARYETQVIPQLNGAVEVGYHGPTSHYPENRGEHAYGDMSGLHVMAGPIWYPPVDWIVKPYIGGFLGWSFWSFNRSQEVRDLGISVDLGNSFAKKVCVGGDYKINEQWSFNTEINYFQSHVPKDAKESDGRNSLLLTDEKTIGQEEICIVAGLKYKF